MKFRGLNKYLLSPALAAATIVTSCVVYAVDTEIYRSLNNVNQNLLFIIDTSPSMDANVVINSYDSDTIYTSTENCDGTKFYYGSPSSSTPPPCSDDAEYLLSTLTCNDAVDNVSGLSGEPGYHIGYFAAFNDSTDAWGGLDLTPAAAPTESYVECRDDWGNHGQADGNSEIYPLDGNTSNAWTTTAPSNEAFWDGKTFTILYSANYLNWYHGGGSGSFTVESRLDIVKDAVRSIVDVLSNVNIGLMRFDTDALLPVAGNTSTPNGDGGLILLNVQDVDGSGFETSFNTSMNNLTSASLAGTTPLAETLWEAVQYMRGNSVVWGTAANGTASITDSLDSSNTSRYNSPIDYECQETNIVVLSDGEPTKDSDSDLDINSLTGSSCSHSFQSSSCLGDLAAYIHINDNSSAFSGDQFINTYGVGFSIDSGILADSIGSNTGGEFYSAIDETTLLAAVASSVNEIQSDNSSFAAPTTSINAFDRVSHSNDLYFSVFTPSNNAHWDGNIKLYEFGFVKNGSGDNIDEDGDGEFDIGILDANGVEAVDEFGVFKDSAKSFWTHSSVGADGADPAIGGAASRIHTFSSTDYSPADRSTKVYTYTQAAESTPENNLTDAVNRLSESNSLLTVSFIDPLNGTNLLSDSLADNEALPNLLKWGRGVDVEDEDGDSSVIDARPIMGAPLHGEPIPITYQDKTLGNDSIQRDIVFIPTNDGYLHAFDNSISGNDARLELWAFVPPTLLDNLYTLKENSAATDILYGLDGPMDVWVEDANSDGFTLAANDSTLQSGEHTYLYMSQRRGGRDYYALDVSLPETPNFLWSVTGSDNVLDDFYSLGQSWSRPRLHRLLIQSGSALVEKEVIIFGGGFDTAQDAKTTRSSDSVGNSIFILDATDGSLLWRGGGTSAGPLPDTSFSSMSYSIPADIRVLDISGDGIADRFYVVDLGGQVWRIDIDNSIIDTLTSRISGGVIADLQLEDAADAISTANNRRFFYPPDIALIEPGTGSPFLSISVGSGARISPNSTTVTDRFYLLKDYDIRSIPVSYTTLYEDDILDVTDSPDTSGLTTAQGIKLSKGWYITFEGSGEKSLATALTATGQVFFTTFAPSTAVNNNVSCPAPNVGTAHLYVVDVLDGGPVANLDGIGASSPGDQDYVPTKADRIYDIERPGIAPAVSIAFPDLPGVTPKAIVGTEVIPITFERHTVRTYWYEDHAF
ncbi:MAG: type IV pilus assembly protein PilY1 [Parasphingorhabdus sp.]|jgi:type IV pilus assembly protein PilY1